MVPIVVKMSGNLNRCIRTAHTFGAKKIVAIESGQAKGNLYSAKSMEIERSALDHLPSKCVVFERDGDVEPHEIDWSPVTHVAIGGESYSFPRMLEHVYARVRIDTANPFCLTGEAALAIAMYAATRPHKRIRYVGWGLWASPLPRRRDVLAMSGRVKHWYDLTQRDRVTVARACEDAKIIYHKVPTPRDVIADVVIETPAAVSCFHGRGRTGLVVEQWRKSHVDSK